MKFEHLLSPMKVGNRVYKNRIVSAPMAFSLIAQDPMAAEIAYRKLEGPARGGNACVILGETDVNFHDCDRIPGFRKFDFAKPEEDMDTFNAVKTYADRIKAHDCIALAELVHCGREKVVLSGPGGPRSLRDHELCRLHRPPHDEGRYGPHRERLRGRGDLHAEVRL